MTHDIAWATGVFEGEGYIVLHKQYASVRLGMTQSDLDILERMKSIFGGTIGPKTYKAKPSHWKETWQWRLGQAENVRSTLEAMLPLLGERRACKALDALDKLDRC